ncbi:DUF4440 domain-containing protein [Rhizobiales bacterium RZME27]|uniref:DUF4440 domain-containing protein n=1 Tax=Endobacterium cereale TaxID=2663029 RepID=A0A6A8AGB3_9HYPH|nr:DUF4440 domain-containing protein [Endobacterium cereale]MEB2845690.1 DUF4440 domain-containing protein [Endobacterium cereale]MQY50152.1 DUF4440 domain-containing protein [Endobacterium cereale]
MAAADLREHLLALETELQTMTARNSEARLRKLIAPDFHEFGRSGKSYTFAEILSGLTSETVEMKTAIEAFEVSLLCDTIALATYRGIRFQDDGNAQLTNRSSIWRLAESGDWRMIFHQGTPTTSAAHFLR